MLWSFLMSGLLFCRVIFFSCMPTQTDVRHGFVWSWTGCDALTCSVSWSSILLEISQLLAKRWLLFQCGHQILDYGSVVFAPELCWVSSIWFITHVIWKFAGPKKTIVTWHNMLAVALQFETMAFASAVMAGKQFFWYWVIATITFYGATWER